MGSRRLNLDDVKRYVFTEGCEYISHQGHLSTGSMTIKCRCGHIAKCRFKDFKRGSYRLCPSCAHKHGGKKGRLSYDDVKERISGLSCTLLSSIDTYEGQKGNVIIKGRCGHEYATNLKRLFQGKNLICPSCQEKMYHEYRLLNYDTVKKVFEDNGCILLDSSYLGNTHKMEYICRCGHRNRICYNAFQQGAGRMCPLCAKKLLSQLKTEESVNEYLLGTKIFHEFSIEWKGNTLRCDLYCPDFRIVVEYNGPHHYRINPFGYTRNLNELELQKERDATIREWCIENNITYLEINGCEWYRRLTEKEEYKQIIGLALNVIERLREKDIVNNICIPNYKDTVFLLEFIKRIGIQSLLKENRFIKDIFAFNNHQGRIKYSEQNRG